MIFHLVWLTIACLLFLGISVHAESRWTPPFVGLFIGVMSGWVRYYWRSDDELDR